MEDKILDLNKNIFEDMIFEKEVNHQETLSYFSNEFKFNDFSISNMKEIKIEEDDFLDFEFKRELKLERRISKSYNKINFKKIKNIEKSDKKDLKKNCFETISIKLNKEFKNLNLIGSGHSSRVYSGINKIDNKEYAIKQISIKNNSYNEVKIFAFLNKCKSKNFIRYYNSWIENNSIYIVLEKCKFSLNNLILKKFKFTENYILRILIDISNALKIMHQNDFIHFDIKPENILISNNGEFKLNDFDLTKNYKNNKEKNITNYEEGDSRYMDPLILKWDSNKNNLKKSDIYGLGLSIYQLMKNKMDLPLNGEKWQNLRSNRIIPKIQKLNYSSDWKNLLIKMTDSNPLKRPSSQQINFLVKNILKKRLNIFNNLILKY